MPMKRQADSARQGTLFEDDYLLRTLGTLGYKADAALTELVANSWDAGAAVVQLAIPEKIGEQLSVVDDGAGMTPEAFRKRWMTLGYDRTRHQGTNAEFPPERANWRRHAYGHNGVGRHGLLCFGREYEVETWRDGAGARFKIGTSAGDQPFKILSEKPVKHAGHGTALYVTVQQRLPDPERILAILAARFLHDPQFEIQVNGKAVPLSEHSGLIEERQITVSPTVTLRAYFVDSTLAGRTTQYQGIAFWVARRLVGDPSWLIGGVPAIDGRTRLAKRYTAIISTDDLVDEVLADWSGFRDTEIVQQVLQATRAYVSEVIVRLSAARREETKSALVEEHASDLRQLPAIGRMEVGAFIEELTLAQPQAAPDVVSAAVAAVINLEKARRGHALLEKLSQLSENDIDGLDRLLGEWTVRDALTVLDEIDRRINVLEAIEKLAADASVDELHSLHPLVTQARWVFGPEFDSSEYTANVALSTAMRTLLAKQAVPGDFLNARRRPDVIVLADGTLSATATEQIDEETGLAALRDVLIIELKKGASKIGRDEINQATGYVEDLLRSGHLDGHPSIRAFVVGHEVSDKVERTRKVGESERGVIRVSTYNQLVRTGRKRLFSLRDRLSDRYSDLSGDTLLRDADEQLTLDVGVATGS